MAYGAATVAHEEVDLLPGAPAPAKSRNDVATLCSRARAA